MPLSSRIQRFIRHSSLPQLLVFEACARLGSFAAAARELHMASPTVSIQIHKLEAALDAPLFERRGQRMALTRAGSALQASCGDIFDALARTEAQLAPLRGEADPVLRLAVCPEAHAFTLLLLRGFLALAPATRVELRTAAEASLQQRLQGTEEDLYLLGARADSPTLIQQAVLSNPLDALAPEGHPLCARPAIPLAELARHPLLLREEGAAAQATRALFRAQGLQPDIHMLASDDQQLRQAVAAGFGLAFLPRHAFAATPSPGLCRLDLADAPAPLQWQLAYRASTTPSATARRFMQHVRHATPALLAAAEPREARERCPA